MGNKNINDLIATAQKAKAETEFETNSYKSSAK